MGCWEPASPAAVPRFFQCLFFFLFFFLTFERKNSPCLSKIWLGKYSIYCHVCVLFASLVLCVLFIDLEVRSKMASASSSSFPSLSPDVWQWPSCAQAPSWCHLLLGKSATLNTGIQKLLFWLSGLSYFIVHTCFQFSVVCVCWQNHLKGHFEGVDVRPLRDNRIHSLIIN